MTKLLVFNTGALYRRLRSEARRQGIRWSALMLLKDLSLLGPLGQRQLAEIEELRPATLSLLVKELLAEGLVSRQSAANDRRAVRVAVTAAGRERLERDTASLAQVLERKLEPLDEKSLDELLGGQQLLGRIFDRRLAQ